MALLTSLANRISIERPDIQSVWEPLTELSDGSYPSEALTAKALLSRSYTATDLEADQDCPL